MHIEPHGCLFYFRYLLLTTVPSRFMRKIVCRLRLNEVSRQ
jgi:hypothetical protein